jgi:hypothetical protein
MATHYARMATRGWIHEESVTRMAIQQDGYLGRGLLDKDSYTRIATRGWLHEQGYTRMAARGWLHEDDNTRMATSGWLRRG